MNIFILDQDPKSCADSYRNEDLDTILKSITIVLSESVRSMIYERIEKSTKFDEHSKDCENCKDFAIESGFDLQHEIDSSLEILNDIPKKSDQFHNEILQWCNSSIVNFNWMYTLGVFVNLRICRLNNTSYTTNFCLDHIYENANYIEANLPTLGLTDFYQIMPVIFQSKNSIMSYTAFYESIK